VISRKSAAPLCLCFVSTTLALTFILSGPTGNARTDGASDRSPANHSAGVDDEAGWTGILLWNGTGSAIILPGEVI